MFVSAPLVSMLLGLALSAVGLIPSASATYDLVWSTLMPLAAALYLLESDLRKLVESAGPTLGAFAVGAVGTVTGTILAFLLLGAKLGPDGEENALVFLPNKARSACRPPIDNGNTPHFVAEFEAFSFASLGVKLAAALCASYIGGSVNFAATAQTLGLQAGPGLAGAMAADNIAMAAYIGGEQGMQRFAHQQRTCQAGKSMHMA